MTDKKALGKVVHYFDKIMVAVVSLNGTLKLGDSVKFTGQDKEFTQEITSMQVNHEPVESAKKGSEVALKVDEPVKRNWKLYKAD
jgi:putative protease